MVNKKKRNKKLIAFLAVLVFIILLGGIFSALVFSNSSYSIPETKVSSNLIDKIRVSENQGSVLELNKDELNQIIGMYLKKDKSFAGINIKGAYGDLVNTNLKLYIPVSYKGLNLLLSSEGSLAYKNDKIEYKPLYFKVGKVTLPKTFVLDKLQSHFAGVISSQDGVVSINKNIIPIKIKSMEVNNSKVLIGMVKGAYALEEKIKSIESQISKNVSESQTLKEQIVKDSSMKNSADLENNLSSSSNSSGISENTSEMDSALNRINESLSSAMGSVSSGSQKAVISELMSTVNSMQGNPSADPYSAGASVKAAYKALSPQEKSELKSVIFSNINGSDINTVNKILGK